MEQNFIVFKNNNPSHRVEFRHNKFLKSFTKKYCEYANNKTFAQ